MRSALIPLGAFCIVSMVVVGCGGGAPLNSGSGSNPGAGGGGIPSTSTGSLQLSISDPAACKSPTGTFAHVYVTITDVQATTDGNTNDPNATFADLTPGLSSGPQQVDLLGQADSHCFLASLGYAQALATGNYQQMRVRLAPDSSASSIQHNSCGAFANCVILGDGSVHDLGVTDQAKTGLVIPVGQIANGGFNVTAGQTTSVDLDFDTCSSIVSNPDGSYVLKPVMHAGEVTGTSSTVTGTVVSSATGQALQGGVVVVALEQADHSGTDRILMQSTADSNGNFVFCPVPTGTYDLVAVGVDGQNIAYSAGVETGIQQGQVAGKVALVPGTQQASVDGSVTTQKNVTPAVATSATLQVSALQQLYGNGPLITVPLLPSQSPYDGVMDTASSPQCPAGVDCSSYLMQLPAAAPNVVACSQNTAQFTQASNSPLVYTVDSIAQVPGSSGAPDCQSSEIRVSTNSQGASLAVTAGQTTTAAGTTFTDCE